MDYNAFENCLNETLLQNLTSLKILDLSYTQLTGLPDNFFNDLINLSELNLLGNSLGTFLATNNNVFTPLASLKRLFLQANGISTLNDGLFQGLVNLKEVYLNENKFNYTEVTRLNGTLCLLNAKCKLYF